MDGQGLFLPLMDGLRNGPYRMCHAASGDLSMSCRGGPKHRFSSLCQDTRGESGDRMDDMSSQEGNAFKCGNSGAAKGKTITEEILECQPGSEQVH